MTVLTPKETNMLRLALGLKGRNKIANRNTFFAAGWDAEVWQGLIARGLAVEDKALSTPMSMCFRATKAGFEAIALKGERLSPEISETMDRMGREAA